MCACRCKVCVGHKLVGGVSSSTNRYLIIGCAPAGSRAFMLFCNNMLTARAALLCILFAELGRAVPCPCLVCAELVAHEASLEGALYVLKLSSQAAAALARRALHLRLLTVCFTVSRFLGVPAVPGQLSHCGPRCTHCNFLVWKSRCYTAPLL